MQLRYILVLCIVLFFPSQLSRGDNGKSWENKMQGLYKNLAALLTDVSSTDRYYDPSNKHRIEREAERLANYSHDLQAEKINKTDADPTVRIVAAMIKQQSYAAVQELKQGDKIYARALLRSIPSYCITCHTRNENGPRFSKLELEPNGNLSDQERGDFFAASRQFDRAIAEYEKVIRHPKTRWLSSVDWIKAIQKSLAITVRVEKNPAKAKEIVQSILDTKNAPSFMKEDAKVWKRSIEEWEKEKPMDKLDEESLYQEATRLMTKAHEIQKYPMDRTADVLYWRASSVIHDLLGYSPNGAHSAEALLLAGISYEVLSPLEMEDLHEIFYENCIRKSPHSALSEACYHKLDASLSIGSKANLEELHDLSQPK